MTEQTTSIAANLRRAADIIEERGWYQGYYSAHADTPSLSWDEEDSSPVCAVGAINVAYHGDPAPPLDEALEIFEPPAVQALGDFLGTEAIGLWNDFEGRTVEEVTAALREAAAAAEEQGK